MKRLNNKGQSLVLFVIFLPIILMIIVLVYDIGNALYEKESIDNTNYMVIEYGLDNISLIDENDLISLIEKNTSGLDKIDVLVDNEKKVVTIKLSKKVKGIMGGTFGFDIMDIKSSYVGKYSDDKKIIERAGD